MAAGTVRAAQHDIQRTAEITAERLASQSRIGEPTDIGRERIVCRKMLCQQPANVGQPDIRGVRAQITTDEWEFEIQLAQPV